MEVVDGRHADKAKGVGRMSGDAGESSRVRGEDTDDTRSHRLPGVVHGDPRTMLLLLTHISCYTFTILINACWDVLVSMLSVIPSTKGYRIADRANMSCFLEQDISSAFASLDSAVYNQHRKGYLFCD